MTMLKTSARIATVALTLAAAASAAHAGLIGATVSYSNQFFGGSIGSGTNTVGAGVEFSQGIAGGFFNIDVDDGAVSFFVSGGTAGTDVRFGGSGTQQSFDVFGLDAAGAIIGIDVTVNGVTGLLATPVSFTADSISLAVGGSLWRYNTDSLHVRLITNAVPAPATLPLALTALGLLAVALRRRA